MTAVNLAIQKTTPRTLLDASTPQEIILSRYVLAGVIIAQIVSIVAFLIYLKRIALAYGAAYGNEPTTMSGMIQLYDTMTKFWQSIFTDLAVPIPMAYRILNPLCAGAEYVVLYVLANNYAVKRKIGLLELGVLILMCIRIVMNGSRSPLFRAFTFVLVLLYILSYRQGKIKVGDLRLLGKVSIIVLIFAIVMLFMLVVMGRNSKFTDLADHLFVYLGAPIVNLDTFLQGNEIRFFGGLDERAPNGAQTFRALYLYVGKWLGVTDFQNIKSISVFAFSSNGLEIGNVYTMFYKIIYDFGYFGIIPLTMIMGLYYCIANKKVMRGSMPNRTIDFRLLIYSYLFNDVVMSAFSNRFYETVFDPVFIKLFIAAWLFDFLFLEHGLSKIKKRVKPIND